MKKYIFMAVISLGATLGIVMAMTQDISTTPASVERLDPAMDKIVSSDAKLEKIAGGYKWTEGPVWMRSGFLLYAEIPSNRIMKWTSNGQASVFLHPSGYQGSGPYGGPESGSNGMTLDARGRLTVAGHARRNVFRFESLAPGATLTVLAERYQGKRLNSPNDVVFRSDGSLYFTDPPYGLRTQSDHDPEKELPFNGVFRIPHALSHAAGAPPDDGKLQLVIKDLTRPNGVAFSPDEKYLYVAISDPAHPVWMRYAVHSDGSVTDGKIFCDASGDKALGGPDGMKLDRAGNIYGSGPGGVWIISPEGKHIGTIKIPERMANCAWGDANGKTLYITASSSIYRIRMKAGGVRP